MFSQVSSFADGVTAIEFSTDTYRSHSKSTIILGGLLDRCRPDPNKAEILKTDNMYKEIDGITYLKFISNIVDTKQIGSLPVKCVFVRLMINSTTAISHQSYML